MLLIVNQVDESIEAARQCIALDPENSDAYRIMGYAQIQKGDKTAARQNLQKAVELGDESAQELINQFLK
jgi:Flp pilus assembly protein TadD